MGRKTRQLVFAEWVQGNGLTLKQAGSLLGGYSESVVARWMRAETAIPKAVNVLIRTATLMELKRQEHGRLAGQGRRAEERAE